MKFKTGEQVVAIRKTSRKRDLDSSASYYRRLELNQRFLYVNGIDEEETERVGEPCYWCDAVHPGSGDSYRESDLVPYRKVRDKAQMAYVTGDTVVDEKLASVVLEELESHPGTYGKGVEMNGLVAIEKIHN